LIGIFALITAEAPADPRLGHALGVADGNDLVLEGEVARGRDTAVETLVEPHVGRHDQRPDLSVIAPRLLALRPHQRAALARKDDHVGAGTVGVALLVSADRKLGISTSVQ